MLHFTNGDHAAEAMAQAGITGRIIPWRDVLHEGPVPAGLDLNELRSVRARFLSECGWGTYNEMLAMLGERDGALIGFGQHEEVVLWFEHDLYDQLQLVQLLAWFAGREIGETRLSLVGAGEYLSRVTPGRLRELLAGRSRVTREQLELGRRAWTAFTAPQPTTLEELPSRDLDALPFLRAALRRYLEELPSTTNGLSRSEHQALEAIAGGAATLAEAFRMAHLEREDPLFLGDWVFADYLERMSAGSTPLLLLEGGDAIRPPARWEDPGPFWRHRAVLTKLGLRVLAGEVDWLELQPIDRWLGGVHLRTGVSVWRWNPGSERIEQV
jgi:hypothetical protein